MSLQNLPERYTSRPATMRDAGEAVALFNACSLELTGERPHDADEQRVEWRTPGFNMDRDTRAICDSDGALVGYAEVWDLEDPHVSVRSWGRVHPEHQGLGIGSALLAWEEQRARRAVPRAPTEARVILRHGALVTDVRTRELLERNGFEPVRYFQRMIIEMAELPRDPAWPDGIAVRGFDPEKDLAAAVRFVRDVFSDHWGHVDSPFEEELKQWVHWIEEEKGFDPSIWFLAESAEGIAGTSLCWPKRHEDPDLGWIHILGVDRGWRRRGLALALLHHSCRGLYGRGKRKVGLAVDAASLTGANRLSEKAGMKVVRESVTYEKELRPAVDLSRRALDNEGGSDGGE